MYKLAEDDSNFVVDNKGYTGHEMLDLLDLVHMNGRVYDPLTSRFLSADPVISDPLDGQRYNRYTYVLNNPTNLTDPSGFEEMPVVQVPGSIGNGAQLGGLNQFSALSLLQDSRASTVYVQRINLIGRKIPVTGSRVPQNYIVASFNVYTIDGSETFAINDSENTLVQQLNPSQPGDPSAGVPLAEFTNAQRVEIRGSLKKAQQLVDSRIADIDRNSLQSQRDMEKWFFGNKPEMRSEVRSRLVILSSRLSKMSVDTFRPSGACMPKCADGATSLTAGAFVVGYGVNDPHIYLNYSAFASEYWSLPRLIIHEGTHFFDVGAKDYVYGIDRSLGLRTDAPRAARTNADSISYFVTGGNR